jgi:hypothetical protein
MSSGRRSSNNPFQQAVSAESTGNDNSTPPTYPVESNTHDYYSSSTEKQRQREREREIERQVQQEELPPSYEEAAGPKTKSREYPREKEGSRPSSHPRSRSQPSNVEEHRTRVHRAYTGDGAREARESGARDSAHRSSRPTDEHRSERRADRERRHKERREHREHRDKDHKSSSRSGQHRSSSDKKKSSKSGTPPKNVDTIDKLDVTGLFGGAFHHDGPFDACTPHRNKDTKAAPVLAFPADGPNSSIRGASGRTFKDQTIDYIHGLRDDDDDLYTSSVSKRPTNASQDTISAIKASPNIIQFDTKVKADPVHGETTLGLGSSTFLDGAPAASSVAVEEAQQRANIGGLNRKKSFRQRITGSNDPVPITNPQKSSNEDRPIRFNDDEREDNNPGGNSLLKRVRSLKVGKSKS